LATQREILWLDPHSLVDDPDNVRQRAEDGDLAGLAATIREYGILQPLGIRRVNGSHVLVYGSRRRRAAIMAGQSTVPCVEVEDAAQDRLTLQLLENLQRRDLNDLEKAEGFHNLRRSLNVAHPGLRESSLDDLTAQTLGLSVRTIQRYLGLRELSEPVREIIARGDLTVTQAQHLRAVGDKDKQAEMARAAVERGLSAATISRACNALSRSPNLPVEAAILAAVRGDEVPVARAKQGGQDAPKLARPPRAEPAESDADLFPEDAPGTEEDERPVPVTADGNRVFRIHTVDAFCDEVARLARALQEGDLAKAAKADGDAATKIKLATRQVEFCYRELTTFCRQRGWA
jgi:ParB family chromosome partitioning protein